MGGEELKFVKEAFDLNWIAPLGPHVNGFEEDLCNYTHAQYSTALSSGTAAIHLALIMLGVKRDDEVLVSTFTFSGSVNPILYQGAVPVFVDSEEETWNMDPVLLEEAIKDRISKGKKPKAIILVHLYGMPAKIDEIMEIAERYEIPVIEDAAEALGSTYNKQHLGTFGKIGILSFNGNKIITTSGGGAIITDDKYYADKAKFLSEQARDPAPHYQHTEIGYNYRLSNVCAAIGRGQMLVLDERVKRKREINAIYRENLEDLPGVKFLKENEESFSNMWLSCTTIVPEESGGITREVIRKKFEAENIDSRPLWKPMHLQPVFQNYPKYVNGVSEKLFNNGLCLPSGTNLDANEMKRIISIFKETYNKI